MDRGAWQATVHGRKEWDTTVTNTFTLSSHFYVFGSQNVHFFSLCIINKLL